MKAIMGTSSKGMLGEFEYLHEFRRGIGHRVRWCNPPMEETKMIHNGDLVIVDFIRPSNGIIVFTRKSDGVQSAAFPWELKLS